MDWTTVEITSEKRGRNTPYASIGYGRIELSAAACDLIEHCGDYEYVELLVAKRNNSKCVGVRFLKESTKNSIKVKRRVVKGKVLPGVSINNKKVVEDLFSMAGTARKTTRYNVEKDTDCREGNILIIYNA